MGEPTEDGRFVAERPSLAIATCRLSLELAAGDEKLIRDLQELYERLYGKRIGLGQLFGLLARWAMASGELPSLDGARADAPGPEPATDEGEPAADPALARASVATSGPVSVGETASGTFAAGVTTSGTFAAGVTTSGTFATGVTTSGTIGGALSAAERPATGRPPAGRRFVPKVLEVVVSIAETGWKFTRTSLGWLPATDGALTGFLSPPAAVPLANLRIAAIGAAEKASGSRHRPAAVDRYLLARSGGYCEVGTCRRRAVAGHHRNRFAFDPSHHPDSLVCVCSPHHGLPHGGEIADERLDPHAWSVLPAEDVAREQPADISFQAHRQASIAGRG